MKSRQLAACIEACFPKIRVVKYRRIRMGWETVVLDVNDEYIFRFLNLQSRWSHQEAEIRLLEWLSTKLTTVEVPHYEFVWKGSKRFPNRFAGYRRITGSPATSSVLRSRHLDVLGKYLGRFLTELHNISPPRNLVPEFDRRSWLKWHLKLSEDVRRVAYPLLNSRTTMWAEEFWPRFLDCLSNSEFTPRLIHSDLSAGNLVINPSTGGLNGIIDWGNAKVADPASDFMGIFFTNRRLGEEALENYELDQSGIKERVELYLSAWPLDDIITGLRETEPRFRNRFLREGLIHLRQWLGWPVVRTQWPR